MTISVDLIGIYYAYLIILYEVPKFNNFYTICKIERQFKKTLHDDSRQSTTQTSWNFSYLNRYLRRRELLSLRVHERKYCVGTSFKKIF